ncbi:aminoglycoside phosphotransferase family protein [Actinopolymorpha sp. B9G3]|uniref:phosphotransferase enzyme family protein n=1 Tax=Actinopolymorpha sp. B9G3 TaxID=3158970 RepID=UPI0032D9A718
MSGPPAAELVAEHFGLGPATGPMVPVRHVSQETWRLDTTSGSALVKRFWEGPEVPWRADLERAMDIERQALDAGVDTVEPIQPPAPQFGAATAIDGHGVFRAYPYLEHRPLEPGDEIAGWLGTTLARIHQLQQLAETPELSWWYGQFTPLPPERWNEWLGEGRAQNRPWAATLADRLGLIHELGARILDVFTATGPYVLTHRDFEPWNVLMTPTGEGGGAAWRPVLIDWDVAGPDSAPLEAAHVATVFAMRGRDRPDVALVRQTLTAYEEAGGHPVPRRPDLLVRLLGMRLSKLRQWVEVALSPTGVESADRADREVLDRLERLPAQVADVSEYARVLSRSPGLG